MKPTLYHDRGYWGSIQEYIFDSLKKYEKNALCVYLKDKKECSFTYGQMLESIKKIGSYTRRIVKKSRHASILGRTTVEWLATYYSMLCYGIPAVPLDVMLSKEDLCQQFLFSDSDILFFDSSYSPVAEFILSKSPKTVCIPLDKVLPGSDISVRSIMEGDFPAEMPPELDEKALAEIVFTSGTTGLGKGVMLSNENITSNVMFGIRLVDLKAEDRILSIMPNNHTYELTVDLLTPIYFGVSVVLNNSLKTLKKNISTFKPAVMLVVPALLSMMQKEIMRGIIKKGKLKKFKRMQRVSRLARCLGIDIRRKVFAEILDYFGGELKTLICGGSFLPQKTVKFYDSIGIRIIEGYGITECAPIVFCNTDRSSHALGEMNIYCEAKCIDGEICVRGKNLMAGYYKNEAETEKAIRDGWFHTGDLGFIDKNNHLHLTGRKTNLIINSNGENISPELIENRLSVYEAVADCLVFGENDLIAVSIYPNSNYIKDNGIDDVYGYFCALVNEENKKMPHKMRIEKVYIKDQPFEKTTTMKIKRYKETAEKEK